MRAAVWPLQAPRVVRSTEARRPGREGAQGARAGLPHRGFREPSRGEAWKPVRSYS